MDDEPGQAVSGEQGAFTKLINAGFENGIELFGPYIGQLALILAIYVLSLTGIFQCCDCLSKGNRKRQIERIKFMQLASLRKKPKNALNYTKQRTFSETKKDVRKKQLVTYDILENKKY